MLLYASLHRPHRISYGPSAWTMVELDEAVAIIFVDWLLVWFSFFESFERVVFVRLPILASVETRRLEGDLFFHVEWFEKQDGY